MEELSKVIEYTSVKSTTTAGDVRSLCKQALINKYRAVCVNSGFVRFCQEEFKSNDDVLIVSTAGFPTGGGSFNAKVYEAIKAAEEGAREIDFVLNLGFLKERKDKEVRNEIKHAVRNTKGLAEVKIIIEAPLLTQEEIVRACTIAVEEGAAYIKTATGFNGETTEDMVKLIRKTVGNNAKIKAAGGIRDMEAVKTMLKAGADTIGTSTLIKFDEA
ncbi:MAG: deoxyribose-phosphate aldolase [Firmicutes bacterium]|nr:deoxyribose-phosphate aldolase [Bacillota bacterium]